MNSIRPSIFRVSALLPKKPLPMPSPGPPLPPGILVDEEISPIYDSKRFYPAKPGEVLADRYQALVKVGSGVLSTVWLARDLQEHIEGPETIVALKIASNNTTSAGHEHEIEDHISSVYPSHRGHSVIRTLLDSFQVQGPEGSHSCLVYPPMREPLSIYQRCFDVGKMPLPLIKTYIRALLTGLDYLHKECWIVHTVYQSRNDFGPLRILRSIPQLVDFGLATRLKEDDDWGVWPIQPDHYRAPEVIMGNGWQMPTDIWNLGVLLWDMIEGKELFQHIHDQQGRYDAKLHMAEMTALLNSRLCKTVKEYFCGPFFDCNSRFLYKDLIPDQKLSDMVSFLEGEDKDTFLDLAQGMLDWHQDRRKKAAELAGHPFLQPKETGA
ncbi:kinase-like protein [Aspergillus egyptiacus]|nr:kinase-like protein [Aspergillus egyptiacus]